jgi:hypothetical protein
VIQIFRSEETPARLKGHGAAETQRHSQKLARDPSAYKKFEFKHYWHTSVKEILLESHNNKCCYCEQWFAEPGCLEIEHFRPKGGVRQARSHDRPRHRRRRAEQRSEVRPGYWWLANVWGNLLLVCRTCNKTKDTFFPLKNPSKRARTCDADIDAESPVLVDPVALNPRSHIRFDETGKPCGITRQGSATIGRLKLERDHLVEARLKRLREVGSWIGVAFHPGVPEDLREWYLELVESAKQPCAPFSSMVIDYVSRFGL